MTAAISHVVHFFLLLKIQIIQFIQKYQKKKKFLLFAVTIYHYNLLFVE